MTMEVLSEHTDVSDVTNNNVKHLNCLNSTGKPESAPVCIGCSQPITDQYVMKVQPDILWHSSCLRCHECLQYLDETCTCFFRDGRVYCKNDYMRLFTCSKCNIPLNRGDFVMWAKNYKYHVDCFNCVACSRQLMPGDECALRDGELYCREDNEVLDRNLANTDDNRLNSIHNNNHITLDKQRSTTQHDISSNKMKRTKDGKPTRVRTVLSEKQLHTLKSCYGANPRPDALMKEQLVEMTGLSPRVIRVWFQNKRCKDKKKNMLIKHMTQTEKGMSGNMQGVSMVAQSPLGHDSNMQTLESYHHQPWKRIPEYNTSQRDDLNHNTYSSLMNSMYVNDHPTAFLGDEEYMDCIQPSSVSSQFSQASTSPHSSG